MGEKSGAYAVVNQNSEGVRKRLLISKGSQSCKLVPGPGSARGCVLQPLVSAAFAVTQSLLG